MAQKPALKKIGVNRGSDVSAWLRGACAVLGVCNPVISALTFIAIPLVLFQRWVKAWWVVLSAGVVAIIAGVLGGVSSYLSPYREVSAAIGSGLPALVTEHWSVWVAGQLPLAIPFAFVLAGVISIRRRRVMATWRQEPKSANERQVRRSLERLDTLKSRHATLESLDDLVVTLGVHTSTADTVQLPAKAFGSHCYIDGPSGFGKTTDLLTI